MIAKSLSEMVVWCALRLVAGGLFRVRVFGAVPSSGPVLLVSNHVTHLDAFLIGACFERVVRFLVWKPYYDSLLFGWGLRMAHSIPIWASPRYAAEAIARARVELERGEIVCIFAEGSISRTGKLLPFKRGLEAIGRDLQAPIVPVHLGGLWESVFSFNGGRFLRKLPRHLRHPVVISFGPAMPSVSTAHEVQQVVDQLRAGTPQTVVL